MAPVLCLMEYNPREWKVWLEFTRRELQALSMLMVLFALAIGMRWYAHVCTKPKLPIVYHNVVFAADSIDAQTPQQRSEFEKEDDYSGRRYAKRSFERNGDSLKPSDRAPYTPAYRKSRIVELNSADTIDLRNLPAIGPWLARKIVEYRDGLGGFISVDQLLEVYRMTPEKLDTLRPFLVLDTAWVERFNPNTVTLERLLKHPYFSATQAKGFISYRHKHGGFKIAADLKKCLLIDEKTYDKIRDYIEVR